MEGKNRGKKGGSKQKVGSNDRKGNQNDKGMPKSELNSTVSAACTSDSVKLLQNVAGSINVDESDKNSLITKEENLALASSDISSSNSLPEVIDNLRSSEFKKDCDKFVGEKEQIQCADCHRDVPNLMPVQEGNADFKASSSLDRKSRDMGSMEQNISASDVVSPTKEQECDLSHDDGLIREFAQIRTSLSRIESAWQNFGTGESMFKDIHAASEALKVQIEETNYRNEELRVNCTRLEAENKGLNDKLVKAENAEKHLKAVEDNCSQLQKLNVAFKSKVKECYTQGEKSKKDISEAKKVIDKLTKEKSMLEEKLRKLEKSMKDVNKLNDNLKREIDHVNKEMEQYRSKSQELQKENGKLMNSLSCEMNNKMSRNESDVENVCIKSRPLKLQEEFELFCSDTWLEAKQALDGYTEKCFFVLEEKERHKILVDIMLHAGTVAESTYVDHMRRIEGYLDKPFHSLSESQSHLIQEIQYEVENERTELDLAIGKYLKQHSDQVDCEAKGQEILEEVLKDIKVTSLNEEAKSSPQLLKYATDICKLAWKMCIQKPPMKFYANDIGESFNPKKHELVFLSKPPGPSVKITYFKYPALFHGDKLMKKGLVCLQ